MGDSRIMDDSLEYSFDSGKLRREQWVHLMVSLAISAVAITGGILLMRIHPLFMLISFLAVIYFIWWPASFVAALIQMRRPIEKLKFDYKAKAVLINGQTYKINEDHLYVIIESNIKKFMHYCAINLVVTDDEEKVIARYFMGPAGGSYSRKARSEVQENLPGISYLMKNFASAENVLKEKEENLGVVRIEFPAASVRNTFYGLASIILGVGDFGLIFSFIVPYINDGSVSGGQIALLRFLSVGMVGMGIFMALYFWACYRRLARTVEVRPYMLKINDREFYIEEIVRIEGVRYNESPDYSGEEQSWLYIYSTKGFFRFYLGQARNRKCFEPRGKLRVALIDFYKQKM